MFENITGLFGKKTRINDLYILTKYILVIDYLRKAVKPPFRQR